LARIERRLVIIERGGCECPDPQWALAGGPIPAYRCSRCDALMTMPAAKKHLPKGGR